MKTITWMIGVLVCLFPAAVMVVSPSSAADALAVVVGRVYHIEGDLLRYIPKDNDWVAMVQERAKRSKEGTVNREARIEPPKTTNYIVPANQVNRPTSEIALQLKEIKGVGRGVPQPSLHRSSCLSTGKKRPATRT